jgi:mRNA interferase RelE/StbE
MTYQVVFTPSALRALPRLPQKVAAAVVSFIYGDLAETPRRVGKPMREPFEKQFSARRGDYRIRYRVMEDRGEIEILNVSHRADAYRPE